MAYLELNCGVNKGNTALQNCAETFGYWKKIIVTNNDFELTTKADAENIATWVSAENSAADVRIYPLPSFFNIEPTSGEAVYESGIGGVSEFVREGRDMFLGTFEHISLYLHTQLRKHNGRKNLGVFILTSTGYILGHSDDGIKFKPLSLSEFFVEKQTISTGDDIARTKVKIEFSDSTQWNDKGVWVKPSSFDPLSEIIGVKDVEINVTVPTTTGINAFVGGYVDGEGLPLLTASDFVIKDSTGANVSVTAANDNGAGNYTLTATMPAGSYTIELVNQPAMSVKGFETPVSTSFTTV